jgi:hypothetical protein
MGMGTTITHTNMDTTTQSTVPAHPLMKKSREVPR